MIKSAFAEIRIDRDPPIELVEALIEINQGQITIVECPEAMKFSEILAFWIDGLSYDVQYQSGQSYQVLS